MKKLMHKIGFYIGVCGVIAGVVVCKTVFAAPDSHITETDAGKDYVTVIDTVTSGTNTNSAKVLALHGIDRIVIQVDIINCETGSVTFGLSQSLNDITYGSITACELIRVTNTLVTGSSTTGQGMAIYAPDYGGTHTNVFVGMAGTAGTATVTGSTTQFYIARPTVSNFLKFDQTLVTAGTSSKFRITTKKAK